MSKDERDDLALRPVRQAQGRPEQVEGRQAQGRAWWCKRAATWMSDTLLTVENLTTVFDTRAGAVAAVDDVSFEIRAGETLGLVGESGSGKSVTALSIMRLVQPPGRIASGRLVFKGRDLLACSETEMQAIRGAGIALIFQEPMTALK